jgi:hypothetical protein
MQYPEWNGRPQFTASIVKLYFECGAQRARATQGQLHAIYQDCYLAKLANSHGANCPVSLRERLKRPSPATAPLAEGNVELPEDIEPAAKVRQAIALNAEIGCTVEWPYLAAHHVLNETIFRVLCGAPQGQGDEPVNPRE